MVKVYLIAGMGADTRIYNRIDIPPEYEVIPVDWIEPNETDTLTTYAQKLIYHYDIRPNSIIIGNSLGGMLAMEMAKKIGLKKIILISSIKTISEAPTYFKFFRIIPVYKIFNNRMLGLVKHFVNPIFGAKDKDGAWLFKDMYDKTSKTFILWAAGAALHWDNKTIPPNVYHIHGDKDRVFNFKKIKNAEIVQGGTHLMIFDRAKEVNRWLKAILKK